MSDDDKTIRVGSRKSELALIQTKHVIALLQKLYPHKKFEIHTMSTIGDRVLNVSLPKIGEKSLFTRDLEDALRNGGVDFVVHSLKDLPTSLPTGMAIGAVLEREDARDALVLRENFKDFTLQTLPAGCVIGTSSLRRTAQLRRQYPHLNVCDIRGNLNTRLAKLDAPDSKFSGIILAQAGLVRMGWMSRISQVLEPTELLYAVGQGALAVECRANDNEILDMLRNLICLPTTCRILAERSFLKTLGGGCSAPVAVVSQLNGCPKLEKTNINGEETNLSLEGAVWSLNGSTEIRENSLCTLIASSASDESLKKRPLDSSNGATIIDRNGNGEEQQQQQQLEEPPQKRTKQREREAGGEDANNSSNGSTTGKRSPPVISDDIEIDQLTDSYDLKELIEKHIDLAKKCPIVGNEAQVKTTPTIGSGAGHQENGNVPDYIGGGGDADRDAVLPSSSQHCPLHIEVGQDFMGQCPFVDKQTKVNLAQAGICPMTQQHGAFSPRSDQVDHQKNLQSPTINATSKCPFASAIKHNKISASMPDSTTTPNNNNNNSNSNIHAKCPFLHKTAVEMFDYKDEEKPLPKRPNILIEDVDDLFCGLYQHKCFSRDLFVKSHHLGQQLAENLIKKGALDVMKAAQAEVHSKIS